MYSFGPEKALGGVAGKDVGEICEGVGIDDRAGTQDGEL